MGKDIQAAGGVQLRRQCEVVCFCLGLLQQYPAQVHQRGRRASIPAAYIFPVHQPCAAVQNRPLLCREAVFRQRLKNRQDELHLIHQRILALAIRPVDIQCIEVDAAVRGNGQHLAAQRLDQLAEFTLRVQDKDIIFCAQGDLHQFLFRAHALAAARHAQPE